MDASDIHEAQADQVVANPKPEDASHAEGAPRPDARKPKTFSSGIVSFVLFFVRQLTCRV